jgi:hypothetical protein
MIRSYGRSTLIVLTLGLFTTLNTAPVVAQTSAQKTGSVDLQEVLSWLPEDTETISVGRGPFIFPPIQSRLDEDENRSITDQELAESFETLPLSLFGFKDGLLLPRLKGKQILLAIEGARHFRPTAGFGQMPYEGCAVAVFADDFNDDMDSFVKENRKSVLRVERIEGQSSAVVREKLEHDTWTFFVAFPNKRTLVVATNRDYLKEVLSRLQGKKGNRALPSDLPEWKFVDTELRFWGLRHFDKSQANMDPTSPFGAHMIANEPDPEAIGLTFAFDQGRGRVATITYLSGDKSLGKTPDASLLSMWKSPEAQPLNIKYRELAPGVVEGTYTLQNAKQVQFFFFAFEAMLGHAIFI